MHISHEVPLSLLEESQKFNDYEYALAPLVLINEKYRDFYKKQSEKGRKIWLDNGAYELGKPLPFSEIIKAAKLINPTHFIFPDILQNAKETMKNYKKYRKKIKNMKHTVCVQGSTEKEFIECYEYFSRQKFVDTIAIPFNINFYNKYLTINSEKYALARQIIIDRLLLKGSINYDKEHHLLGCTNPIEFTRYRDNPQYSFIKSVDTSCPITMGFESRRLTEEGLRGEKSSMLIMGNIDKKPTNDQRKIIKENIKIFAKLVNK